MNFRLLSLAFYLFPFFLRAQSDSVISEKPISSPEILQHWYRNSYQPKSANKSILKEDNASYILKLNSYKKDMNFLYVHSYRYHYFLQMPYSSGPVSNFNSYAGTNNVYNQGSMDLGPYLVASGINYVLDKAISGRIRK
ncbi:MAG: hypothetical protein H7329_01780 [Opitutaceae bacterium]|nr:hypothetical protein [Cytophagales bacterium]